MSFVGAPALQEFLAVSSVTFVITRARANDLIRELESDIRLVPKEDSHDMGLAGELAAIVDLSKRRLPQGDD